MCVLAHLVCRAESESCRAQDQHRQSDPAGSQREAPARGAQPAWTRWRGAKLMPPASRGGIGEIGVGSV